MTSRGTVTGRLRRELGLLGAVMMGLGSMVDTGVFVSIGLGAGIAGPAVILVVALAAGLATCNGLTSAQIAASHPVSGGTYEYGYRYLTPWLGFTAGWMFLTAKCTSAASAALGFAGYLLSVIGLSHTLVVPLALAVALVMTGIVLSGIRPSNLMNGVCSGAGRLLVPGLLGGTANLFNRPGACPGRPTVACGRIDCDQGWK